jgi:hypothetical protein
VYEFNDLPTGTYDALVYVDNVRDAKGNSVTFALGHTEVTVRKALANQFMLVAHVRRAVLTVDDPLLEFDVPPMQRRRKVLASIFRSFPQSAAPRSEIRELGLKPPYEQGEYKRMTADDSQNTCAAVNTMTYDLATGGIDSAGKALGNGASAGFNSPRSLGWTPYADGLQPSVGDVACYRNSKGEMAHCGFVVGVVQLRKPSKPDEPVGGLQIGWLSADGGQPDRTTEFPSGASGWRRYYSPPRNREAAFVLPRLFVQLGDGRASVQNLFIFPLAERGGYAVEGWLDISQARFGKLEYDEFGTEEDYRAMKALLSTFPRRVDAARQADQDIQSYAAEVPDTTSGEP